MRLLQLRSDDELSLTDNLIRDIPSYAILSHTWGRDSEEVTFQELTQKSGKHKAGYQKLVFCGKQARRDGLDYFWVDTCCIDKTSSAELTEAINSMFKWYQGAQKCYVYLADVVKEGGADDQDDKLSQPAWTSAFRGSKWFTRGWTLQELIAPSQVEFFSSNEQRLGDKSSLEQIVHEVTRIPLRALQGCPLLEFGVEERISWLTGRGTTRAEDMAYSLLGILGITISIIYGEGEESAFRRIRREANQGDEISPDSSQRPQACRAIHFPRNSDFVPRSAISEQLARLLPPRPEYQSAALWGLGGSGKTQLALEYAYDRCKDPACSVFWVHADTETSFTQDYKWIATKLGLAGDLDGEKLLTAVRVCIESLPQWVLVLDNADDLGLFGVGRGQKSGQDAASNISAYVPRGTVGTVLWTSRDQGIVGSLVGSRRGINVIRMAEAEADTLFQTHAALEVREGNLEYDDLVKLLVELGWLPLAITQAAAYIRRTKTSIAEYLQLLQHKKKRWKVLKRSEHDPHRRPEVTNSVLETWNISMEYMERENTMAYNILTVLAYVENQNIPFLMIVKIAEAQNRSRTESCGNKTNDHSSSAGASGSHFSDSEDDTIEDDVMEAVARLVEFSFLTLRAAITSSSARSDRVYDMHKLVQEAIAYNLHAQRANSQVERDSAKVAFDVVDELFPKAWLPGRWEQCEQYLGHAQRISEWAAMYNGEEAVGWLLSGVSRYLFARGRWREREKVDNVALQLRTKVLGGGHPDTLTSYADLAVTYSEQGRYSEAVEIKERVLQERQDLFGVLHKDTIWAAETLAITYQQQGKYDKAEKLRAGVLEIQREILGNEHLDTISSLAHLATTYSMQGKYNVAEKMGVEVLGLRQKILGERDLDTICSMADLAATYHMQGKYTVAQDMGVKVLGLRREILGDKHPHTISIMADLVVTYISQGEYNVAEKMVVEVLELQREILGDKHPDTISSMANLATTYCKQGKNSEAEEIGVEVLALRREILGPRHPDTILSMGDLATTYNMQGKYNVAEKIGVEVLGLRREILGDQHPLTISSMGDLAATYYEQGKTDEAEGMEVEVLALRREILGPEHPDTILAMANLAFTYHAVQKFQEAEEIRIAVVQLMREVLGEDHPYTLQSIRHLESTQQALEAMLDTRDHDVPFAALALE